MKTTTLQPHGRRHAGFSLVEILLSVGILGIGLVMVATVFPVGASWTRRGIDDSVAQTVAQDALAVLQSHYPFGSANADLLATSVPKDQIVLFPQIDSKIPASPAVLSERCYKFGDTQAFPAYPDTANYFWTALVRTSQENPSRLDPASPTRKYDVYILVFRMPRAGQQFIVPPLSAVSNATDLVGTPTPLPTLSIVPYNNGAGSYNQSSGKVTGAVPPIGDYGIGANSGTVFRQSVDPNPNIAITSMRAAAYPPIIGPPSGTSPPPAYENVIIAPPPDGTTSSSLVYVFQTTLTY